VNAKFVRHCPKSCDLSNFFFLFIFRIKYGCEVHWPMGKNAVFLSFVFTFCFSSMIHGDSICWNEKYEESEKGEEMVGMWWKKKKGQTLY
jgi:hypothetical protein